MLVKHEIKSQLAKLLATEDLIVEHKKVDTAQFNVHTRVLLLPQWEKASNNVYDSLVAHEVGHALYTPDRWDWLGDIPQQFVNVVEDARIEKLMRRRYAGIAKTFNRGYNELHNDDFFNLEDEDITTFNLADRANLFFKIGAFLPIVFSPSEKQIISLIEKCETFDDTLDVAKKLYEYCKIELEKKQKEDEEEEKIDLPTAGGDKDLDDMTDKELLDELESELDPQQSSSEGESTEELDLSSFKQGGEGGSELELHTVEALAEAIKDLNSSNGVENNYVELPKVDLRDIIISNKEIHNKIDTEFVEQEIEWNKRERVNIFGFDLFDNVDKEFLAFKKNAQKEVNYLVKEFECKKAADSYARATTNRTGILDTTKLHTYKFNEDLFKKISVVPDGKNHGLVFLIDWSGSMQNVMLDTIKQMYNLLWFCKKVNIPFEVYAFTNNYPVDVKGPRYDKKEGFAFIEETFSLMNLFTSKVKTKVLEEQMVNIWRVSSAFNHNSYVPYNIPLGMNLSGTPLNEAIICLHQILPKFKKENKLQKVQCIVLTDGEGAPIRYSKMFHRSWESEGYMGTRYVDDGCIIRNRKTGYTYSCQGLGHWADVSNLLIRDLRQTFPDMNFIGIRVLVPRDAGQFIRNYTEGEECEKVFKRWKKEKSFAIKTSGYHTYFGLSSTALANEDEFEVKQDATKAEIKRAFVKSLKVKKMNKKILGEFIELVA